MSAVRSSNFELSEAIWGDWVGVPCASSSRTTGLISEAGSRFESESIFAGVGGVGIGGRINLAELFLTNGFRFVGKSRLDFLTGFFFESCSGSDDMIEDGSDDGSSLAASELVRGARMNLAELFLTRRGIAAGSIVTFGCRVMSTAGSDNCSWFAGV